MPTAEEAAILKQVKDKGLPVEETQDEEVVEEGEEGSEDLGYEVEVVEEESEVEEVVEDEEPEEMSESERSARESGWKPKDEWDGDPEEWVSAGEFNRRGELLRKIHNQNRQLKQLDDVVTTLAKQQKQIFEAGYAKAERELKSQLREANKEGDDATAEAIEERMEALKKQREEDIKAVDVKVAPQQAAVAPEFESWVQRNQWFIKDPALRAYAEKVGIAHAEKNPAKSNSEIYQYVTDEVKKRFPEEFGMTAPKKKTGSPVLSGGPSGPSQTVRVALTQEEKAVGRALVEKGIYKNMNEYATDLKKFGVKNK